MRNLELLCTGIHIIVVHYFKLRNWKNFEFWIRWCRTRSSYTFALCT